ncbi:serine/threonine-protein kinase Tao-like [Ananas comosus]|uniref:Serine/threonine-protein kinase Tao-like n=1 Tax=Ananas comosus TaxID=4615 RepID=A0A6P5FX12_ANACO|nr:serine/threonine-protein kinase Tao-like [Ananas comosus]
MEPRRGAAAVPPPPPRPPQPKPAGNPVATPPPPPMPESKGMETYDYFFGPEYTVPPPTLGQLEEQVPPSWPERRDLDTDRRPNKVSSADDPVVTIAPEKEAAPPRPPPTKAVKKVKQGGGGGGGGGSVHHQHAASAGAAVPMESSLKKGKAVAVASVAGQPSLNLVQLLNQIDDHFLQAFLSAHEVSKMLESTRMHYHSNFVDKRGRIDHSARVMKAITWNRSFKGLPQTDDANDDFDNDEWETHATILDKMLAWEKKLYDEVKAGELMKIEYQRKVALLNKQKKRGVRPEVLEKTKSAVSHLHTRYIVDMQSMDSTVSEINRLRDHQLYPKLVDLVDGMGKMWGTMYEHHRSQLKIATGLRAFDISLAPKETSEAHHDRTIQLCEVVREWHSQFQKLMLHQKEYIKALNSWLKLNLIPIESSLKEKVSSPPRQADPPIKKLLHAWNDFLDKLPDELARAAINSFAEVIHNIVVYQQDELKSKHKCDETRKELDRKKKQFDDWRRKYMERRASMGEENTTEGGEGGNPDPVVERKIAVEALEIRLKEEEENHKKQCKQVREKSLGSLRMHLPELFRSLSEFAIAISEMYKKLWSITQSQEEDED